MKINSSFPKNLFNQNDLGDNAGLFGNTILYSMGNLFSRSVNFLLLPIYSNVLNTYEFGIFSLVFSTYTILSFIYPTFLQYGFTKFYITFTDNSERKNIYSSTFYATLVFSLILSIFIISFSGQLSLLILGDEKRYLLITLLAITLFVDTLTLYLTNFLKSNQLARIVIRFTASAAVNNLFLNIIFLFAFNLKTEGVLLSQIISNLINSLILLNRQKENLIKKFDSELTIKILKFSVPLLISGFFGAMIDVIDRFILNAYFDKATVGIYSFSYRIAMVMNVFVMSFRTAWIPYATEKFSSENISQNFGNNFTRLIALSSFLFLIVSLCIDDLFNFQIFGVNFFNKEYEIGIKIIPVILLGYIFNGIFTFYSFYPFVTGKNYHILIADGISLLINILLNLWLIPVMGIMGAAIATAISFFINALYLFIISSLFVKISYQPLKFLTIIIQTILFYYIGRTFDIFWFDLLLITSLGLIIKATLEIKLSTLLKLLP